VLEMVELVCRLEQKKNWKRFPCQMMWYVLQQLIFLSAY
jgi:hypothetical protein